jgi:hypothetical protein
MKQILKMLGRILLWALPALLAIYVVVKLADYCWYRAAIPVGFYDANWTGKWDTEQYFGATGRILVKMPDPLPKNTDFKAEALVYYPIYFPWKTGQFVKMDFVGHFSPDNPASTGQSTNRIPGGGGGKLKFKAKIGDQVVDYVAIIQDSHSRIAGSYLSQAPHDYGFFWISYY